MTGVSQQVDEYLQEDPFTAKQTPENEIAYERLMDVRLKLYVGGFFFTLKSLFCLHAVSAKHQGPLTWAQCHQVFYGRIV
jgi:hypothetical protein